MGVILVAALLASCQEGDRCGPSSATVVRVIDGDTVELDSGERVRYLLIDSPESTSEIECFGEEATELNRELVEGKVVQLRYESECRDRFERLLAFVSVGDREINTLLVERGYACTLFIPPNGLDRKEEFEDLELRARAQDRGLWGSCENKPC